MQALAAGGYKRLTKKFICARFVFQIKFPRTTRVSTMHSTLYAGLNVEYTAEILVYFGGLLQWEPKLYGYAN